MDMITDGLMWLGQWGMRAFTALFIVLGTVMYIGQLIFTQLLIKIGFMLMPIMVPFMMLERTKFIFEGWVKFMVTAGFTKIVGAVLFGLMSSNVTNAVDIAQQATADGKGISIPFVTYATLFLLTGLTVYIMAQTQQIGNSLVSGFVQGGFRFSPVAWGGAAGRMAGAAAGAVKNTGVAAGRAANSIAGGANAARTAAPGSRTAAAIGGMKEGLTNQLAAKYLAGKGGGAPGSTPTPVATASKAPAGTGSKISRPGSGTTGRGTRR